MSETSYREEVKMDNQSQLMLWELRDGEWERALILRRAANLGENRQVFYRMEKYLIPGGLVEEHERENSDEMRRFRLTEAGKAWVENRGEKLKMPTTHDQIQKYALEGYEAGTDAKESVQNYRKKLHRLKRRIERAEEDVEAIEESEEQNAKQVQYLDERTQAVRGRSKRNNNWLDELQEEVDDRETIGGVDEVRESVTDVEGRLREMESKQAGMVRQQGETERSRAEVRRLAKPAGYGVIVVVVAYLAVVVGSFVAVPELFASVVIGGITGLLGVVIGIGLVVYAQGGSARADV